MEPDASGGQAAKSAKLLRMVPAGPPLVPQAGSTNSGASAVTAKPSGVSQSFGGDCARAG